MPLLTLLTEEVLSLPVVVPEGGELILQVNNLLNLDLIKLLVTSINSKCNNKIANLSRIVIREEV